MSQGVKAIRGYMYKPIWYWIWTRDVIWTPHLADLAAPIFTFEIECLNNLTHCLRDCQPRKMFPTPHQFWHAGSTLIVSTSSSRLQMLQFCQGRDTTEHSRCFRMCAQWFTKSAWCTYTKFGALYRTILQFTANQPCLISSLSPPCSHVPWLSGPRRRFYWRDILRGRQSVVFARVD